MNRFEAKTKLCSYLKRYNITFRDDFDNGTSRITMLYKSYNNCPDKILESCIWFYENEMEIRVYYDEKASNWCRKSEHIINLMRVFNYINALVWPCTADGKNHTLYQPHHLHTPRLYMTEDGFNDITLTSVIAYDFYAVAPLETEDYITACCPELLDKLSPVIFGTLLGQLNIEQAIGYVKEHVLEDKEKEVFN